MFTKNWLGLDEACTCETGQTKTTALDFIKAIKVGKNCPSTCTKHAAVNPVEQHLLADRAICGKVDQKHTYRSVVKPKEILQDGTLIQKCSDKELKLCPGAQSEQNQICVSDLAKCPITGIYVTQTLPADAVTNYTEAEIQKFLDSFTSDLP